MRTILSLLAVALAAASPVVAQPSLTLDPTWSGDGVASVAFPEAAATHLHMLSDLAVTADGGALAAGAIWTGPGGWRLALARFTTEGAPDPSVGTSGRLVVDAFELATDARVFVAAAADGGVVAAVDASTAGGGVPAVLRLLADGTPDPAFGEGGVVALESEGGHQSLVGFALRPDGRPVVALDRFGWSFAVVQLTPEGALDPEFGWREETPGTATARFAATSEMHSEPAALAVLSEGGLAVVGQAYLNGGPEYAALARLEEGGGTDNIFAVGGVRVFETDLSLRLTHVIPHASGLVAGSSVGADEFALLRLTAGGALDLAFGDGGYAHFGAPAGTIVGTVIAEPDGGLLAAGSRFGPDAEVGAVFARVLADGTPDPTFGDGGVLSLDEGSVARRVVPVLGGRLLIGGRIEGCEPSSFCVYRMVRGAPTADEPLPTATGGLRLDVAPNPTRGNVRLALSLDAAGPVVVEVFDTRGRRAAVLHEGALTAGHHALSLDVTGFPSGLYLVRARSGEHVALRSITVVR